MQDRTTSPSGIWSPSKGGAGTREEPGTLTQGGHRGKPITHLRVVSVCPRLCSSCPLHWVWSVTPGEPVANGCIAVGWLLFLQEQTKVIIGSTVVVDCECDPGYTIVVATCRYAGRRSLSTHSRTFSRLFPTAHGGAATFRAPTHQQSASCGKKFSSNTTAGGLAQMRV